MQKIVRIDLQSKKISIEEIREGNKFEFYAGRSLSSKIVAEEVPPDCDPLGPQNKLIFATGFLSATPAPNSGRMSVGSKSPLTGGVKEANVGGRGPALLAKHGIRGLIFEDCSSNWVYLKISHNSLELVDAKDLIGLNNYAIAERLSELYGSKVGAFSIGIAGEKLFHSASIASIDMQGYPSRHAGRGGMGAVMGSKKLKAVVLIPDSKEKFEYSDKDAFNSTAKLWFKELFETKKVFSKYGTALGVSGMNATHGLPTQNFRRGNFKDADKISGDALHKYIVRNNGRFSVGCSPGCAIRCSNIVFGPDGKHITSSLEYETIGMNGSNLLIGDIEKLAWIDHYADDIGMDSIEGGNALAMYMESGKIKWGDADAVIDLLKGVNENHPESLDLGLGCYRLGKKLGVKRIPHVKKQGFPAYEPRSYKGMGITFYTSPMGADHTAGPAIMKRKAYATKDYGEGSPWDPNRKVLLSKELQIFIMLLDSMGLCYFVGPSYEITERLAFLLHARFGEGWEKTADDWIEWSKGCLKMEHDFNLRAGIDPSEDKLPDFILNETLDGVERTWDVNKKELDDFWNNM